MRFTHQKSALNLNQEENITVTVCNKQEFCAALGKFPKIMIHIMLLNEIIITECMTNNTTRKMIIIMRGEPSLMASGVTVLNI